MNVRRAAAVALLLGAGALAAPAGATPVSAPAAVALPPGLDPVAVVTPDGVVRPQHRPLDALLSVRDHRDTGAWLRSVAAASRRAGGDDAPEPIVVDPDTTGFSGAAGDLDGDGREDVVSYTSSPGVDVLHARRGTDGAPLWSRPLEGDDGAIAFPLGRDLTGDGVDDLLVDDLAFAGLVEDDETGLTGGSFGYGLDVQHHLAVLSGVDGSTVWQQRSTGRLEESYTYTGDPVGLVEQGEYRLRATGFALLVGLSEDVDGDALPDLVLNDVDLSVDAEGLYAAVAYDGTEQTRGTTRSSVVSGATGTPLLSRTVADVPGLGLLLPFGQVGGGAAPELLWSSVSTPDTDATCVAVAGCVGTVGAVTSSVEVLDPERPDTPLWRSTAPGQPFVSAAGDVDGDGVPDVVRDSFDERADRGVLEVLSGRDGRVLWTAAAERSFPPLLVDVQDGLALTVVFESDEELAAVLQRRDAATGVVRSTERVQVRRAPVPPGEHPLVLTFTSIGIGGLPDADGDGGREVQVGGVSTTAAFSSAGDEEPQVTHASQWQFGPLAGGAPLLSGSSDDVRVLFATGDLDGDGLEDAVQHVLTFGPDATAADSTGLRLRDGGALWRSSGPFEGVPFAAGDQDGRPGVELVQDRPGAVVESRSGTDLGLRWRR